MNLAQFLESDNKTALALYYLHEIELKKLYNKFKAGYQLVLEGEKYISAIQGMFDSVIFYYYKGLCLAGVYYEETRNNRGSILRELKTTLKKIKSYSEKSPENHLHQYYHLKAELEGIYGRVKNAIVYFDKAIKDAKENSFLHQEAYANESAARFYNRIGSDKIAILYLRNARYCYIKWGASVKVKHLEDTFPFLKEYSQDLGYTTKEETTTVTSTHISGSLDIISILKASQAISGIMNFSELLSTLMHIVMENAGASRGVLILKRNENFYIEAEKTQKDKSSRILHSIPVDSSDKKSLSLLPVSLIYYIARTKEPLIMDEIYEQANFSGDTYFINHNPKSIMCLPLLNQGRVIGVLYFENVLTMGAFTKSRLQVLDLFSSQIAISIENARAFQEIDELNKNLEKKVEERTNELHAAFNKLNETYLSLIEKERIMELDLRTAKNIQQNTLPKKLKIGGLSFEARYLPLFEAGGDVYDIAEVEPGYIRVFLADATGHGVQAALITMIIKSEYENLKSIVKYPHELLNMLNERFVMVYKALNFFFTCVIVDIDLTQGKLYYSSSAHPEQYIIKKDGIVPLVTSAKPVGVLLEADYQMKELEYKLGDKIILFTDGLFEEFDKDGNEFGEERIKDNFNKMRLTPLQILGRGLLYYQVDSLIKESICKKLSLLRDRHPV